MFIFFKGEFCIFIAAGDLEKSSLLLNGDLSSKLFCNGDLDKSLCILIGDLELCYLIGDLEKSLCILIGDFEKFETVF